MKGKEEMKEKINKNEGRKEVRTLEEKERGKKRKIGRKK